jgi:hypothetical protein
MGQPTAGKTPLSKVFYVAGRWVYVTIGAFVGAGAVVLIWLYMIRVNRAGFTLESDCLRFVAVLLALALAATFIATGLGNRIVISPEQIEYHSLGFFMMISPWSNAERITTIKLDVGGPPQPWLVLKDAGAVTGRRNPILLFWKPELRGRAVPLGAMWAHQEDLLAEVRRYTPHLNSE